MDYLCSYAVNTTKQSWFNLKTEFFMLGPDKELKKKKDTSASSQQYQITFK